MRSLAIGLVTSLATYVAAGPLRAGERLSATLFERAEDDDYDPCDLDGPQRFYLRTKLKNADDVKARDNFDDQLLTLIESRTEPGKFDVSIVDSGERENAYQFVVGGQGLRVVDEAKCQRVGGSSKLKARQEAAGSTASGCPEGVKPIANVNGGFGSLESAAIGADVCGNGGCKSQKEYCDAVAKLGQKDPCCSGSEGDATNSTMETMSSTNGGAAITGATNFQDGVRYVVMGNVTDPKQQQPMVVSNERFSAGQFGKDNGRLVASSAFPLEWDAWAICDGKKGYPALYWIGVNPPAEAGGNSTVYIKPDYDCSIIFLELGD